MQKDVRTNLALRELEYTIFRFWTQDIIKKLPIVINQIELFIKSRTFWK